MTWTKIELMGAIRKGAKIKVFDRRFCIVKVLAKTQQTTPRNELFFLYGVVLQQSGRKTKFEAFLRHIPWGNLCEFSTENTQDSTILKQVEDYEPVVILESERAY